MSLMTIRELLLDLVNTPEPLSAETLTARVNRHQNRDRSKQVTFLRAERELEKLVDEGLLYMTEVKMRRMYYA